jgi:RNA polymerase sigma-70 factor (ECF subfamily)
MKRKRREKKPPEEGSERLSRISTEWSLVFEANRPAASDASLADAAAAQQELLLRYCGAIDRYLQSTLRDPDDVNEVSQRFAYCFARGDFRRANPEKGRFRDLLRTILFHQVVDFRRERQKQQRREAQLLDLSNVAESPSEHDPARQSEEEFVRAWRDELLDRAWKGLAEQERDEGGLRHTVLRLRAELPQASSSELAEAMTSRQGRPFTPAQVRQILHRARESFAELLLDETIRSLGEDAAGDVEQELIDLGFMVYCKDALAKRQAL